MYPQQHRSGTSEVLLWEQRARTLGRGLGKESGCGWRQRVTRVGMRFGRSTPIAQTVGTRVWSCATTSGGRGEAVAQACALREIHLRLDTWNAAHLHRSGHSRWVGVVLRACLDIYTRVRAARGTRGPR